MSGRQLALALLACALAARPGAGETPAAARFDHQEHAQKLAGAVPCQECHAPNAAGRPRLPDHASCFGACHGAPPPSRRERDRERALPYPIEEARLPVCRACHAPDLLERLTAGTGEEVPPPDRAERAFPIGRFSHAAHRPRLPAGAGCEGCHPRSAIAAKKASCRGCHDGEAAFSMTAPACRRCHTAPEPRPRPERELEPFSHRRHRDRGLEAACDDCHRLGESGAPLTASSDHAPCSDAGCHRDDFDDRAPKTCGACHIGLEPWLDLDADRPPPEGTEFGARFSHRSHLAGDNPRVEAPCERCHQLASGPRELRPPRGHRACAGEGCHLGDAEPPLAQCGGCHVAGLISDHRRARTAERWTVRPRFTHAPHRAEPRDREEDVACTECHAGVLAADRLSEVPIPAKASCARCHDGRAAFKLTGHTCARCHGGAESR